MSTAARAARLAESVFTTFGEDATWQGVSGPVRVRRREEDERIGLSYGSEAIATGRVIRVRASEVADPVTGQEVQILDGAGEPLAEGGHYRVSGDPMKDRLGVWNCPVELLG